MGRSAQLCIGSIFTVALLLGGCDGFLHVRGAVQDNAGNAIATARIVLEHGDGRKFIEKTDARGCFSAGGTIAPGRYNYTLRAEAIGYKPVTAEIHATEGYNVVIILSPNGVSASSRVKRVSRNPCAR